MPKLKLKVTHTHAGVAYPAGHVIDVDDHTARWLADHSIAEPAARLLVTRIRAGTTMVPIGSMWRSGLRLMRPSCQAVGSPKWRAA